MPSEYDEKYRELLSNAVKHESQIGRVVAFYCDCRVLNVPITIEQAIEMCEITDPETIREAKALMLTSEILFDAADSKRENPHSEIM